MNQDLQRWLAYAVLTGYSDEAIFANLNPEADARALMQAELAQMRQSPLAEVGQDFARQLSQVRWLLELQKKVHANAGFEQGLTRLAADEHRRFFDDFLATNRPVILEGFCDDWPAHKRWNRNDLIDRLGSLDIVYSQYRVVNNRQEPEKVEASFADFLNRVYDNDGKEFIYWTAFDQSDSESPLARELTKDIRFPEAYCDSDPEAPIYFWIGPSGTRSGLHFDPMNVLFVQVIGSKKFLLAPPQDIPNAYLKNEFYSSVDGEQPDLQRFPKYAAVQPISVELNPGEAMLLPVGWLHQVTSKSISFSVSLTNLKLHSGVNRYEPPSSFQGVL